MAEPNINITPRELRDIMAEYEYNDDIMNDEPQKVRIAKMALSMLNESDRIIWCLALEKQSSRNVGKILGCSHSTVQKQLKKIKTEIINNMIEIMKYEDIED